MLVVDIGGSLKVLLLNYESNAKDQLSQCEDRSLGGAKIDEILLKHCLDNFQEQTGKLFKTALISEVMASISQTIFKPKEGSLSNAKRQRQHFLWSQAPQFTLMSSTSSTSSILSSPNKILNSLCSLSWMASRPASKEQSKHQMLRQIYKRCF